LYLFNTETLGKFKDKNMQNMQNIKWDTSLSQEWLANADDAKASEFAIVLDTTTYGNSTLIDKKKCKIGKNPR